MSNRTTANQKLYILWEYDIKNVFTDQPQLIYVKSLSYNFKADLHKYK